MAISNFYERMIENLRDKNTSRIAGQLQDEPKEGEEVKDDYPGATLHDEPGTNLGTIPILGNLFGTPPSLGGINFGTYGTPDYQMPATGLYTPAEGSRPVNPNVTTIDRQEPLTADQVEVVKATPYDESAAGSGTNVMIDWEAIRQQAEDQRRNTVSRDFSGREGNPFAKKANILGFRDFQDLSSPSITQPMVDRPGYEGPTNPVISLPGVTVPGVTPSQNTGKPFGPAPQGQFRSINDNFLAQRAQAQALAGGTDG